MKNRTAVKLLHSYYLNGHRFKLKSHDVSFCLERVYTVPTLVCYTAVFSVVTQRSSPLTAISGEERCVTTLKTAV